MIDCQVNNYKAGYVNLTLTLPEGLLKSFVPLLDSLHDLFRFLNQKSNVARAEAEVYRKAHDPDDIARREKIQADFVRDVLVAYDGYIADGVSIKKAISMTNLALKAKNYPWAAYHITFETLRACGRFKGVKLYQKKTDGRDGVVSSETPRRDPAGSKKL